MRRTLSIAMFTVVLAVSSEAGATVRLELRVIPPEPVVGQPFHVVYGLYVHNDVGVRATPLDLGRLEVLSNPGSPQLPSFGMFGGAGAMFTLNSTVEYLARAPAPGRYVIRGARALDPATGRVVAEHPPVVLVIRAGQGTAAQPQPQDPIPPMFPDLDGLFPQSPPTPPPPDPDAPPLGDLTGAVFHPRGFLRMAVDNPSPYVGQEVTLRAWLYVPAYDAGCEPLRQPTLTGFWSESLLPNRDVCAQRWVPQAVNGQQMGAGLVLKTAIFPTHAGRLEVGSMSMSAQYLTGGGFFQTRQTVEVESPALVLDAREPPTEGRPEGYVPGTMGPITLAATLDRERVSVGETAVLTVRAEGPGYLASVGLPPVRPVEGLRSHPGSSRAQPEVVGERVRATVRTEYLLVPTRPGRFDLGRYEVPYFDPATGRYDVAREALPALTVTGEALPEETPERPGEDPSAELEPYEPEPALRPHRAWFTGPWRVWGALGGPPALALLAGLAELTRRRWRVAREAQAERARNDPGALVRQATLALRAGESARAVDLAGRALERARKGRAESSLDEAARGALMDARKMIESARFAGESADAAALVEGVARAVKALEGGP